MRKNTVKLVAGLFALTLVLAACSGDDSEDSDDSDASTESEAGTEADAEGAGETADDDADAEMADTDADEPASDDATEAADETVDATDDATDDDATDDDAMDDTEDAGADAGESSTDLGPFLTERFQGIGVVVDDELVDCLRSRDVDLAMTSEGSTEAEQQTLILATFDCAPEEMADAFASAGLLDLPEGTTEEDATCVTVESFRYFGELPIEEGLAELALQNPSEEAQAAILPGAVAACGLEEDQAKALIDLIFA